MSHQSDRWIFKPRPNAGAKARLFCVPYAGGSAQIFQTWPQFLPSDVEVCAINLPGRGRRFGERSHDALLPLTAEIGRALASCLDKPFALAGHSMGALISFELARYMRTHHRVEPIHLFVSGANPPHIPDVHQYHLLPDAEFLRKLGELNGAVPEVLANAELMSFMLPILRADFTLCETYVCASGSPLGCPISVFGGEQDPLVPPDELGNWQNHTTRKLMLDMLPGDHFFVQSAQSELLGMIGSRLTESISASGMADGIASKGAER